MPGPASRAVQQPLTRRSHRLDQNLARIGKPNNVARDLGYRGGDDCQHRALKTHPRRSVTSGSSSRHDVSVPADSDPELVVAPSTIAQWPTQPSTHSAFEEVPSGTDLVLPAPVAAGQGEQHRTAVLRWGSAESTASRYSTRSRARIRFSCAAIAPGVDPASRARERVLLARNLVRKQQPSITLGKAAHSAAQCRAFLLGEQRLVRRAHRTRSTTRCWLRRLRSCSFHKDATRLRAVVMAYGTDSVGLIRSAAPRTRTNVSCTRSSATAGSDTRARMTRRTTGSSVSASGPPLRDPL